MQLKFGVVVFPGSNCDDDLVHVLQNVLGCEVHKIWHKESNFDAYGRLDGVMLPGGFSYGDYLRSGAIANHSPIMQTVKAYANQGGFVMGICNGFQILCESGLLPGALLRNEHQKFICKNIHLKACTTQSMITEGLSIDRAYKIPIAHAEGRYYADPATIHSLWENDQVLFQYCDAQGQLTAESNINGSTDAIAGICNATRNVFGMMPHPERAAEEILGNLDGLPIFQSIKKNLELVVVG